MIELGSRRIFVCDVGALDETINSLGGRRYALLLSASGKLEVASSLQVALHAVSAGCSEVCCTGSLSGELEDALDAALESQGRLGVVTTSFSQDSDALEYFLFAASGADPEMDLVAAIAEHDDLRRSLVALVS